MHRSTTRLGALAVTLGLVVAGSSAVATADMGHETTHPATKGMSVKARVVVDKMKGYNLFVTTKAFRWAPERVNTMHRPGEGHAHVYVDGVKLTRIYSGAFYLGELKPGRRVVKVTLNGNDHGDYVRGGKVVASTVTVTVPAKPAMGGMR
jgi:hypothetical protein